MEKAERGTRPNSSRYCVVRIWNQDIVGNSRARLQVFADSANPPLVCPDPLVV